MPSTRSSSEFSTIHVALPQHSQSDYIPGSMSDESGSGESGLNDKSDEDEVDDNDKSLPKKRARRAPVKGTPRKDPCLICLVKMVEQGPGFLCCSQDSPLASNCYACALSRRRCDKVPAPAISPGQRLQEAAVLVYNGQTVNNWNQLVAQFKQAIEGRAAPQAAAPQAAAPQTAAPQTAAPQAGPGSLSFGQTTTRANPQRLPHDAIVTPTVPRLVDPDCQAQLLQEARAHNHKLDIIIQLLQRSLQIQESGFTTVSDGITQANEGIKRLTAITCQLGDVSNQQTMELRQMHNEMRRVNGNADLPSFAP
ncbi:hypothetical protein FPOA_01571 [Fusarium poae]|uniref:Uncharacterized protein n=1 Tax=Fusarium poae TaxID=36050 RepID=A0A1B8B4J3_FUSPO|nr:hypothetical protein FPOA_01571 [Fusarium poae]